MEGAYDPAEYETLNVSAEIKELFNYIARLVLFPFPFLVLIFLF